MNAQPVPRPTQAEAEQWTQADLELAVERGDHQAIDQAHRAGQLRNLLLPIDNDNKGN